MPKIRILGSDKKKKLLDVVLTFYKKNLKKKLIFRFFLKPIIKPFFTLILLSISFNFFMQKKKYKIVKLKKYIESAKPFIIKIFDEKLVSTPLPKVVSLRKSNFLFSPHNFYLFPEVYLAKVNNAKIKSNTNFVFLNNKKVICHDLYDFKNDIAPEERNYNEFIKIKKMYMQISKNFFFNSEIINISTAATFLDHLSSNYAHWLTEILPKIATFCSLKKFNNVPLIIDDNLHPNILESLMQFVKNSRKIYILKKNTSVKVKKLYLMSTVGYVPYESRHDSNLDSHGKFSPNALLLLRDKCLSVIKNLPAREYPNKIYIKRNSNYRILSNFKEVEKIILNKGYVTIEPEKFSFLEQVAIFKNAKYIIGPTGAALANFIFTSPKTEINIMISELKNTKYWYWQNIARSLNLKVNYILGRPAPLDFSDPNQSDFVIDPITILKTI